MTTGISRGRGSSNSSASQASQRNQLFSWH